MELSISKLEFVYLYAWLPRLILALKRFIGRRSCPHKLFCDNGANFVGAKTQLTEFHKAFLKQDILNNILNYLTINFNFNFNYLFIA